MVWNNLFILLSMKFLASPEQNNFAGVSPLCRPDATSKIGLARAFFSPCSSVSSYHDLV